MSYDATPVETPKPEARPTPPLRLRGMSRLQRRLHSTGRERIEPQRSRHDMFTSIWRPRKSAQTALDMVMQMDVERIERLIAPLVVTALQNPESVLPVADKVLDKFRNWTQASYTPGRWANELEAWTAFRSQAIKEKK